MPWIPRPFDYYGSSANQVLEDLEQANDNFEILGNCFVNDDPTTGKAKIAEKADNADTVDGYHASQTPTPNTIPVADANGKIDIGWVNASATPLANQIPILDANANLILPNTSLIQTNTYTFRRVDLSKATSDYPLAVGEEAIYNFTNATRMPLRIATQDGTVYELHLIPSNTYGSSGGSLSEVFLNPNNTTYSNAFVYAELNRISSGSGSAYTTFSAFRIGWTISSVYCIIINRTVYKHMKVIYNTYGTSDYLAALYVVSHNWQDTTTPWTSLGTITFPQSTSGQILVRRIL
jgi:hypothetical protein